ncbi:MAG: cell division protein ZapA (FtsZ GTPase activity inhibitor) [Bradymonadia bacterium]|jgi:cell division protein ZapA (FtsZ GTPase activity inhibitor)
MVRSVTVTIAGQKLSLRTDASDAELRELTDLLNERVSAIRTGAGSASPAKVHLLTALSLADDLRQTRSELERMKSLVTSHAQGALDFLEEDASVG